MSSRPSVPPPWETALDALLRAEWSKEAIAEAVGASSRTIHRMAIRENRRFSRAVLRNVVELAMEKKLIAA